MIRYGYLYLVPISLLCYQREVSAYGVRGQNEIAWQSSALVNTTKNSYHYGGARSVIHNLKGGSTRRRKWKVSNAYDPIWMQPTTRALAVPQPPSTNRGTPVLYPLWSPQTQYRQPQIEQSSAVKPTQKTSSLSKVDASVVIVYFCNAFAITLPVILTPMIGEVYKLSPHGMTSFCATVASVSIMGGGLGKIMNGMVCQSLGSITTASYYMLGLSLCSLALSMSTSLGSVRWLVAGMEYFSSAMWAACSVVLSNHYAREPLKFARGVTYLSLASTSGQLAAKMVGSVLLQVLDWRKVAQIGALLAMVGSLVVRFVLANEVADPEPRRNFQTSISLIDKVKCVTGSRLFWIISFAHVSGFLARTFDRMMGPFLRDLTGLPHQLCGGLTASATLGFVYGLMKAQSFYKLESIAQKNQMLTRWYTQAGLSFLGLALCASSTFGRLGLSPYLMATLVVLCSGLLSSSVAFQFFQIPNMVSTVAFAEHKAVCLSFMDGMAFFLTAPIWAASSRIVQSMGWSATWGFLAVLFGLGGTLMVSAVQPVLTKHAKQTG